MTNRRSAQKNLEIIRRPAAQEGEIRRRAGGSPGASPSSFGGSRRAVVVERQSSGWCPWRLRNKGLDSGGAYEKEGASARMGL
jgi:hypothetical protein